MRFCPKVEGPCVKQNCISFNRGINISVMDASKMMSFIVKKEIDVSEYGPLLLGIDVGFCSHFGKVIEDDDFVEDVKLMVEGRELLTKEELSEETSNIHSKNMLKMEG